MKPKFTLTKLFAALLMVGNANAALTLIPFPGTGTGVANWTTPDGTGNVSVQRALSGAVNGNGLSTNVDGFLVHDSNNNNSSNTVNPVGTADTPLAGILIDLGSTQNIGLMQIWNANLTGFQHSFSSFSMSYATDASAVGLLASRLVITDATLFTSLTTNTPIPLSTRANGYLGETFTFGSITIPTNLGDQSGTVDSLSANAITARYIFLGDINPRPGGASAGIAEIQFYAIPEPSTALLGGLGLLALLRRRR